MTPLAQIAEAVEAARAATDPDERQQWVDAAHSAVDRMLTGEAEPGAIRRKRDPRRAAIEGFFEAAKVRTALAEGSVTIDLTESECERCGERHELTTTETGRVLCMDHYLAETRAH